MRVKVTFAASGNNDSLSPPLADELIEALLGWQAAHNLLVGLDPALDSRDRVMLGPDKQRVILQPADIESVVVELLVQGLMTQDGAKELVEFANIAPPEPTASNRRSRIASESAKNLAILLLDMAFRSPKNIAIGGLGLAAVVGFPATATVAGVMYGAFEFVKNNKKLMFGWFKDSPAVTSVLRHFYDHVEGE